MPSALSLFCEPALSRPQGRAGTAPLRPTCRIDEAREDWVMKHNCWKLLDKQARLAALLQRCGGLKENTFLDACAWSQLLQRRLTSATTRFKGLRQGWR